MRAPNNLAEFTHYVNEWKRLAPLVIMTPDELRRTVISQLPHFRSAEILSAEMEPNQGQNAFSEPFENCHFTSEPFTQHKVYSASGILEFVRRKLEVLERQKAHLSQYRPS